MNLLQAIILGIIQGLAEFLPISSSGHLILARSIMGITGEYLFFDVMLHLGTLFAVFLAFYKDLFALFKPPFKQLGILALATIPAVIVGFAFNSQIEQLFASPKYLCFFFLVTAVVLTVSELLSKHQAKKKDSALKPLGLKTALIMGAAQAVAIMPGISRSGSTISAGLICKGKRAEVAQFSFFLSIPIILGSVVLESIKVDFANINVLNVVFGTVSAFVCGFIAIKFMMRLIKKANLMYFSAYLLILSITTFFLYFL